MLKNNIKVAFRNLKRFKIYSFINIIGIAVGISVFMLLWLYVSHELSFNSYHSKVDRIYRIYEEANDSEIGQKFYGRTTMPLADALVRDMPEVVNKVNIGVDGGTTITSGENKFLERQYFVVDPTLFDVFDFEVLAGDPKKKTAGQAGAVLTRSTAVKFFGHTNVVGEPLEVDRYDGVEITAIIEDIPDNSDLVANIIYVTDYSNWPENFKRGIRNWEFRSAAAAYVLLEEGTDPNTIMARKESFLRKYLGDKWETRNFHLQPLTEVHLKSSWIDDRYPKKGDILYIYIFSSIGVFVLLIACINYINLATAHALQRFKEVGIRKIVGASQSQIATQFLLEALITSILATVLSIGIIEFALPYFNTIAEKNLEFEFFQFGQATSLLAIISIAVGIVSGILPALIMVNAGLVGVTKSKTPKWNKGVFTRKGLVILQFSISIILIVSTIVVLEQMDYVHQSSLGFNKDQMLVIDINSSRVRKEFQSLKTEFLRHPSIEKVSVTSRVPGEWKLIPTVSVQPQAEALTDVGIDMHFLGFDKDAVATFNFEVVDGSNFTGNSKVDSTLIMINETAAKALGIEKPVGQRMKMTFRENIFEYRIVGVLKDFHYQSLYEEVGPLVVGYRNNPVQDIDYFTLKISDTDYTETLDYAGKVNDQFSPERPMEYNFLNSQLERFYKNDERRGRIFGYSAVLAIFIACLGLFGLASYTAQQRTKEFGIRKVLGASTSHLMALMSNEYIVLIVISFLIATPISWILMEQWLMDFAYRINLHWSVFVLSGLVAFVTALLTVAYKSSEVANSNPIESLRYE